MEEEKKSNKALIAIIVVVLLLVIGGGAVYVMNNAPAKSTESSSSNNFVASTDKYKDGTYNASGSYDNPGGEASVDLTVEIKDNKIASASIVPHPSSGASSQFQAEFVENFKPLVVGKSVNEVNLSRVAGSSLTSGGFNEALSHIKDDAKV
jgi:uncharacterized protein with FMN-binding domain